MVELLHSRDPSSPQAADRHTGSINAAGDNAGSHDPFRLKDFLDHCLE